ncbi:hypothetical protein H0X10_03740 [Candidatus Saccharibacteria bacterium]|nr:hypothetical protein [Candidatus Saccharibacteria bacterium]
MQPNAPSPAPPPIVPSGDVQQYDFIFNPNQPTKKSLLPGGGSKKNRIVLIAVGAVALVIIFSVIAGLINNLGKENTDALVSAAKQQQELIRVAEIGVQKSKTQDAKNIAITTKLSLESEQKEMQAAIQAAKLNPKKVLTGSIDAKTDAALTTAEQNNRFDEEFLKIMTASLTNYQKTVKTAYDNATGKNLKAALTTQYKSANTLAGVAGGIGD